MNSKDKSKKLKHELKFTLDQILEFFSSRKRSTKCPSCNHDGNWTFLTYEEDDKTFAVPCKIDILVPVEDMTAIAVMSCPNCGFVSATDLVTVQDYYKEQRNE